MEVLVKDLIAKAEETLKKAEINDWKNDSWLLAEYVFSITRAKYYMNPLMCIDEDSARRYLQCITKRASKIPLQHITGVQEFMGFSFCVDENVLIPRQDTELLVEQTVHFVKSKQKPVAVLDLCTGSGCIGISVDRLCNNASVTAVDISDRALEMAQKNNMSLGAEVHFIQSDLFEKIEGKFDIIVSNPPYIKSDEVHKLMEEVKNYEPLIALDGDEDGLKFYQRIAEEAGEYLNGDGKIFLEIGYDQGTTVPDILYKEGFQSIKVLKDLSGNDRVVIAGKE